MHHTTRTFVAWRCSRSDHQLLPPAQREALLAAIAVAIDAHGGEIEVPLETHLYLARLAAARS